MHLKFANEEHQIVRINFPNEFTLIYITLFVTLKFYQQTPCI